MKGVRNVVHMNGGNAESSYANNSTFQQKVMLMTKPIRTRALSDLSSNNLSKTICIADLGCSTGSNALLVTSELVETIARTRRGLGLESPEVQVFLNDLPANDFNTVFRLLQEEGPYFPQCYHNGVPGSFYDRLFPTESLHFVHSSYSLHWLSQIPEGLENNKDNICVASTSPTSVREAYYKQFHNGFSMFLKNRAIELVPGGHMVLTMQGRTIEDGYLMFELLAEAISDMVSEGLIEEQELHSFNIPHYTPSPNEISTLIQEEGSFSIDHLETFEINWTDYRNDGSSVNEAPLVKDDGFSVMKTMRSVLEPQLRHHFHGGILDEMFSRFHKKISDCMARQTQTHTNVIVSMKRKTKITS